MKISNDIPNLHCFVHLKKLEDSILLLGLFSILGLWYRCFWLGSILEYTTRTARQVGLKSNRDCKCHGRRGLLNSPNPCYSGQKDFGHVIDQSFVILLTMCRKMPCRSQLQLEMLAISFDGSLCSVGCTLK